MVKETNEELQEQSVVDYSEIISEAAFVGKYPYDTIVEGIRNQFASYMTIEDRTDYVDIFYDQIGASLAAAADPEEEHPKERYDAVMRILNIFVAMLSDLFEERLCLVIRDYEDEVFDHDEFEVIINQLYDFFILNAPDTFRSVITKDIIHKLRTNNVEEEKLDDFINTEMDNYSPLVLTLTPLEFIQLTEDEDLLELFNDSKVVGNFLKKFSPRLYANEEFQIDLVNDIIIKYMGGIINDEQQ